MTHILTVALYVLISIFLFSLAVFIHEFGHFIVARLLGLRADTFSIGFGPALWKKKIGATEYRISLIPFGGYVSLPQLDPQNMKSIQGEHGETLPSAKPWKRILVAVAGPMGNIVLAVVCACMIAWFAPEEATGSSTTIGLIESSSNAAKNGLKCGDKILAVNGSIVESWQDFQTECYLSATSNALVTLTIERDKEQISVQTPLDHQAFDDFYTIGGVFPTPTFIGVMDVAPGSPAEKAGLSTGDCILSVNDQPLTSYEMLLSFATPMQPVRLKVRSAATGKESETLIQAAVLEEGKNPAFGIFLTYISEKPFQWMAKRGVIAQLSSDANQVVRIIKALTAPKNKGETKRAAKALGGPLMIFALLYKIVQTGLWVSLGFIRLICVNLAILNLLPLPVLDGGHILFALYAIIRRKEAPARLIEWSTMAFAFMLLGVMVLFIFRDALRLFF